MGNYKKWVFKNFFRSTLGGTNPIDSLLIHNYFTVVLLRYTIGGNTAVRGCQGVTSVNSGRICVFEEGGVCCS